MKKTPVELNPKRGNARKKTRVLLLLAALVVVGCLIVYFDGLVGNTVESRELRLRQIEGLGESVTIGQELELAGYIVSGYTTAGIRPYGLAVFKPAGVGRYRLQSRSSAYSNQIIEISTRIDETHYSFFWANKADLAYAEITYTMDGKAGETIRLDATDNRIVVAEAPAEKSYGAEFYFYDQNGNRYG